MIDPRLSSLKRDGIACFDKPGVHALPIQRFDDGTVKARLIQSLPDYQGVFGRPQTEVVFDAKVCSQASFNLDKYRISLRKARSRQLRHMYERSSFGSACFFLIHFNGRQLKTRSVPAVTYAFPVRENHPLWVSFESGSHKSISIKDCESYAIEVPWTLYRQERIPRPDVMLASVAVAKMNSGRMNGSWNEV